MALRKVLVPLAVKSLTENSIARLHFIRETYLKKLVGNNLIPVLVAETMSKEMIAELYNECCGVLFVGGSDFAPKYYNQEPHEKLDASESKRDILELDILKRLLDDKKPFLGICRGCQALAIAAGGDLLQHIPDLNLSETHMAQFTDRSMTYEDLITVEKHEVIIDRESKAFLILNKNRVKVTSAHHQSVMNPGRNMKISGVSPSGITEIVEHTDPEHFCFGLQCHPEAEAGDMEVFFKRFAEAVYSYSKIEEKELAN